MELEQRECRVGDVFVSVKQFEPQTQDIISEILGSEISECILALIEGNPGFLSYDRVQTAKAALADKLLSAIGFPPDRERWWPRNCCDWDYGEYGGVVDAATRLRILKRDGYRCQVCGSQQDLCVDHVFPRSKGGPVLDRNLQTLCWPCNAHKGARIRGARV